MVVLCSWEEVGSRAVFYVTGPLSVLVLQDYSLLNSYIILFLFTVLADALCRTGWAMKDRQKIDSSGVTVVSNTIACGGFLSQWTYQTDTSAGGFKAIVWRKVIGSSTRFQIIGINDVPGGESGETPVTFEVPLNERIIVRPGDLIGWSFQGRGLPRQNGGVKAHWIGGNLYSSLQTGETYDVNGGSGYRTYSIQAAVETIEGLYSMV